MVDHVNDDHPTLLFHAAGARVWSEPCNRFRSAGKGWPGEAMLVPVGADGRCGWSEPVEHLHVYVRPGSVEQVATEVFDQTPAELHDRSHVRDAGLTKLLWRLSRQNWPSLVDPLQLDGLGLSLALATLERSSPLSGPTGLERVSITSARLKRVAHFVDATSPARSPSPIWRPSAG